MPTAGIGHEGEVSHGTFRLRASRDEFVMNELYAALLSWAVTLSGYPAPAKAPNIVKQPHSFFVEKACNGRECKVLGWYAGGTDIFIDDRLDPEKDLLASSIVVHEMVHYLQNVARGDYAVTNGVAFGSTPTCQQFVRWEHEAYGAQREYILRYGTYLPVGLSMLHAHCETSEPEAPRK
jgi:hypothetical protein